MQASRSMRVQQQRAGANGASSVSAPRRRVLGLGSPLRSPLVVRASTVLPSPNFSSSSEVRRCWVRLRRRINAPGLVRARPRRRALASPRAERPPPPV